MGDEGVGKVLGDQAGDQLKDVVKDVVNRAGRLAQEELWRRAGGAESGVPAPWDVAAAEDAAWAARKAAKRKAAGKAPRAETGAFSRALTEEEAGIEVPPMTAEQEAQWAAYQADRRKQGWEEESPMEDFWRWLHRHGIG